MDTYEIHCIEEENGMRIRIELMERLIYQIDLSWKISELRDGFISEAIQNRVFTGRYYILSPQYEWILRLVSYNNNKAKKYHLMYLKDHRSDCDDRLLERFWRGADASILR